MSICQINLSLRINLLTVVPSSEWLRSAQPASALQSASRRPNNALTSSPPSLSRHLTTKHSTSEDSGFDSLCDLFGCSLLLGVLRMQPMVCWTMWPWGGCRPPWALPCPGLRFWFPHVLLVPFTLLDPPDVVFPSPCPQLPPRRSRQPDVSTIQYIGLLLSCGRPLSRR